MPNIEVYNSYLQKIWENQWVTNIGPLLLELEEKLKGFLSVKNILITNNGTIPIQIALKVLGKQGEIITTPFSYVATTSAIMWENCTPVFVDIHPDFLTIDENKIEAAITPKTTAILAAHVYGNPCNVDAIEAIAKKHKLKVIYDAAHCFGVTFNGRSIFDFGDISTCSFHATKLFHTGEGGAIFCNNETLSHQVFYSHNFGHNGPHDFFGLGVNGKSSELHAAMGLSILPHMKDIFAKRRTLVEFYLKQLDSSKLKTLQIRKGTLWNYSYFPVIFESTEKLLKAVEALSQHNIFPRRYFYPSLNTISYVRGIEMPVSESIAGRILCLPLYFELKEEDLSQICKLVNKALE